MADVYMQDVETGDIRIVEKDSPEFYRLQDERTTDTDPVGRFPKYVQQGSQVARAASVYGSLEEYFEMIEATVPSQTILATGDQVIGEAPFDGRITHVGYTPEASITGAASPASRTFTLVNKGQAGAGTTVIATLAMVAGVNATAFDEKTITLSATAADRVVAEGDEIVWVSTAVGGTGLVDPGGHVEVEISRGTLA